MEEEKINWIYEGVSGLIDKEEYLTGRKVDKTFEIALAEEKGEISSDFNIKDNNVPSLFNSRNNLDSNLNEDPLSQIKRKQVEIIKDFLKNPLKMKRFKFLLEKSLKEDRKRKKEKKKNAKKKKKKKNVCSTYNCSKKVKKRRENSSSSESSDSDLSNKRKKDYDNYRPNLRNNDQVKNKYRDFSRNYKDTKRVNDKDNEEIIEQKLKKMLDNGKWREDQRKKDVKTYNDLEIKEEKEVEENLNRIFKLNK